MAKKASQPKKCAKFSSEQSNKRVSTRSAERAMKAIDSSNKIEGGWDKIQSIPEGTKEVCRTDGCSKLATAICATSIDPDDLWPMCTECQGESFPPESQESDTLADDTLGTIETMCERSDENGMKSIDSLENKTSNDVPAMTHESESKLAAINATTDHMSTPCSADEETIGGAGCDDPIETIDSIGTLPPSCDLTSEGKCISVCTVAEEESEGDDISETWELIQVLSLTRLNQDGTVKCSSPTCSLVACCVWKSNLAPSEKWFSCMDCQEADFDGWPPHDELPLQIVTAEHKQIMTQKCTKQSKPTFPDSWSTSSPLKPSSGSDVTTNTTPLLNCAYNTSEQETGTSSNVAMVTPMASSQAQPSKSAMAMHRKWQEAAEAVGGASARIVVSKPAAKKLIFNMLHDSFRPMNITQIHTELKAVVPSPVLKSCLTEMVDNLDEDENLFAASDDEDSDQKTPKRKKKIVDSNDKDSFAGSLSFKSGRNVNTSLYYVSHDKLKNTGNGLEPHARNELLSEKSKAEEDESNLKKLQSGMETQAKQLLSEPVNEELSVTLETQEYCTTNLRQNVDGARALKVNEKHKQQIKRRIESMTTQWRKRKRICMDFLVAMEESTDGTISAKKCLAGEGQIDIDSDSVAIRGAKAFASKKKARVGYNGRPTKVGMSRLSGSKVRTGDSSDVIADENFIAVTLNAQGCVCRVLLDDEGS